MLISSRNSLFETSRNKVSPALSASLSSIKLTKKTKHIKKKQKTKHHRDRGERHQNVMLKNLEINLGVLHLKF